MSTIGIREAGTDDGAAWQALVSQAVDSTFFHRFEWRVLLCSALGFEDRYLCAVSGDRLVGVLPLVRVRSRLFGDSLTSLPFCSYAGPLGVDRLVEGALIDEAVRLGRELHVDHVELRGLRPFRPADPRQELYCSFRGAIPAELASMKGIPQKRRNVVRRAASLGLRAVVNRDADRFFELYAENARAHGTPALGDRSFARWSRRSHWIAISFSSSTRPART